MKELYLQRNDYIYGDMTVGTEKGSMRGFNAHGFSVAQCMSFNVIQWAIEQPCAT